MHQPFDIIPGNIITGRTHLLWQLLLSCELQQMLGRHAELCVARQVLILLTIRNALGTESVINSTL
jgi:hypothetical protein